MRNTNTNTKGDKMLNIEWPIQSLSDRCLAITADDTEARRWLNIVRSNGYGLYLFHRTLWEDVHREVNTSDGDLGSPESLDNEWWAIYHCGAERHRYRLIPLAGGPVEWEHGAKQKYIVTSQKADVTCRYECSSLLDALVVAGAHAQWTHPMTLGDLVQGDDD